jgi:hypothetical protein
MVSMIVRENNMGCAGHFGYYPFTDNGTDGDLDRMRQKPFPSITKGDPRVDNYSPAGSFDRTA